MAKREESANFMQAGPAVPVHFEETLHQIKKRCKKMTKVQLMEEIHRTLSLARGLYDSSMETMRVVRRLEAEEHCYKAAKVEVRAVAKVLRVIADEPPPTSFLTHLAEYLELVAN